MANSAMKKPLATWRRVDATPERAVTSRVLFSLTLCWTCVT
jgi:hypothetical protein